MGLRKLLILLACGSVVGCADVSKQDVDALGVTLEAKIAQAVAGLDQKITATDAKYANMLALEQSVKNGVEKIDANAEAPQRGREVLVAGAPGPEERPEGGA